MDALDNLARRAEAFEAEQKEAGSWEEVKESEKKPDAPGSGSLPDIDAAANRAESILRIAEAAAKMFVDDRLILGDEEVANGRDSLAPVLQKYNLMGEGTGRLPYQEEITAGFYLGGLFKRFKRALAVLRAKDKADDEANKQANHQAVHQPKPSGNQATNGEERKHQSQEQPQSVPGDQRIREVSDVDAPIWLTGGRSTGVPLG
ncbi:MAG TPA: hypothetical protein DIW64_16180 [Cellvibrio sp.]|nr:hypothetical protein [Cellvibrio sp.]